MKVPACISFHRLFAAFWMLAAFDSSTEAANRESSPRNESPVAAGATIPSFGERFLFYGNSLVERLLENGELEAYLQLARPNANVKIRSLAWTGDEVGYRLRPEGYVEHMKSLLNQWPADTVVLGFGNNESFSGAAGLAQFRKDWDAYVREIQRLHPGAKLVFLSPIAVQGMDLTTEQRRNADIQAYANVITEVAQNCGGLFVDLFAASSKAYRSHSSSMTTNGIHLNQPGVSEMSKVIARSMLGETALATINQERVREVAKAAAQKSAFVAEVVRPKNGVVYYGNRKRPEENEAEIPRYHRLIDLSDNITHELCLHPEKRFSDYPRPRLEPLPEGKSVPDRYSGGVLKEPEEQLKDLTVAEGYSLNLFASETDFPELKNPVQITFDARGRLWVVTMPSFPHTIPGEVPNDKILILEDTKHQGRADKCTVFAEGFDALDGVAFHEKGVIVSAQPRLLLLKDTDGDGRADTQEELLRGVDVTDSHHGGMIATDPMGDVIFSDGVFHRSQFETPFGVVRGIDSTTYRLNLKTGRVSSEWQSLNPNPWKIAFDRFGNIFQRFGGGQLLDSLPLTWTPLGVYQPYGNGAVLNYGKGSAASVVSSPNFPEKYQQGVISAALLGSYSVSMSAPDVQSGTVVGADRIDLLTSQNSAFRPVDSAFGFDGALYVSDFASRIIGHAQHPMRDPQWNHTRGRIWRVVANDRPVVKDWPMIEGASLSVLFELLKHPQDIVREHVRIELRKQGADVITALDRWVRELSSDSQNEQALLEASMVMLAKGQIRLQWLTSLLKSQDPRMRAAAVQIVRLEGGHFPEAQTLLKTAASDSHPRVRMSVVNAVSHLRSARENESVAGRVSAATPYGEGHSAHVNAGSKVSWDSVLEVMNRSEPSVSQMLADLKAGTAPKRGPSVPVLDLSPSTKVEHWLNMGEQGDQELSSFPTNADLKKVVAKQIKNRVYKTFVDASIAQTVLLNVKHGYVDISVNGVQLLSTDSPYSSVQQVQVDLQKGLNVFEMSYRKLKPKDEPPAVYLCDTIGQAVAGTALAKDMASLGAMAAKWEQEHAADAGALKVQAVPNLMQFSPKELRVKPGQSVRIVFENPDLMQHNLVLVAAGADEAVGMLADQMASKPDGFAKNFVPDSASVLQATPLVNPNGRAELKFTAPTTPGAYPYLCTFPGHWRVMRGVLIVE